MNDITPETLQHIASFEERTHGEYILANELRQCAAAWEDAVDWWKRKAGEHKAHIHELEAPSRCWRGEETIKALFSRLRHNPKHHLGLGDIRLTIAQQDEIISAQEVSRTRIEDLEKVLHQIAMTGGNAREAAFRMQDIALATLTKAQEA